MTTHPFLTLFLRRLRYWTLHGTLNALPSFIIALTFLKLSKSPSAIAAMLAAIGTFILLYATLTSLKGPLSDDSHVLSRALKLGAKIRAAISAVSLLMVWSEKTIMLTPDFWCGFLSVASLNAASRAIGLGEIRIAPTASGPSNFVSIYATTLLEGFILSFILLMISFCAVIVIQSRARIRFKNAVPTPENPGT